MNRSHLDVLRTPFAVALVALLSLGAFAPKALAARTPDAWITTEAKIALVTKSHVPAADVHVDTVDGKVILYGKVANDLQYRSAEDAVRGLKGVRGVRNLLQIVAPAVEVAVGLSDDRIKGDVENVLREDPDLAGSRISVRSVDKGAVLLGGSAKTLFAHWSAVSSASSVPGVRRVATEIKTPNGAPSDLSFSADLSHTTTDIRVAARDSWTTTEVKLRLLADDQVPALDVGVDTNHRRVSLVGTVPTPAAKAAAIADAQKVDGVEGVNDYLQVSIGDAPVVEARDEVVKQDVESLLGRSPEFKHVEVDVKDGRVHLTGNVASGWERLRAAIEVRAEKGVRAVDDDLRVAPYNG